jgi:predicted nucleic acid-binding protein
MTERLFVDTNIWVYAVDHSDVRKQETALAVLQPSDTADVVVSAQVIGEFFAVVTRKLARTVPLVDVRAMVSQMVRLPVVAIDSRLVEAAISGAETWQLSYWDALIIAAAETSGCDRVISEDMSHGVVYGSVQVQDPFVGTPQGEYGISRG